MPDGMQFLGAAIRYHRRQGGWSPETVAHEAKIAVRTYRRIENDERPADAFELDGICKALGVRVEDLLLTAADPLEMRLRMEYGGDIFSIVPEDGLSLGPLLILRADSIDDARAQIEADQVFWALCGWVSSDVVLRPAPGTKAQVGLWVCDAAAALAPGGTAYDPDDDVPERVQRVRNHVLPLAFDG